MAYVFKSQTIGDRYLQFVYYTILTHNQQSFNLFDFETRKTKKFNIKRQFETFINK